MPFWVLAIGVNTIWWITTKDKTDFEITLFDRFLIIIPWFIGNLIISFSYLYFFRTYLNDSNETNFLNIGKIIAKMLRFKLVENFEYVIYRAKLAVVDLERLKIDHSLIKPILIEIEDKSFLTNNGVSIKSLLRGLLSQIAILRKKFNYLPSGGSTITMQLARTLFVVPGQNKFLRKIFEIWIAIWLNKNFKKQQILNLYLASVRYDYGVMGLAEGIKYFFGEINYCRPTKLRKLEKSPLLSF